MARLIREVTQEFKIGLCFQATVLLAIQEAMEAWLVRLMEDMNLCDSCKACYYPAKRFKTGVLYQSQ